MAMPGETVATGAPVHCYDCDSDAKLDVCHSAAGYYVGYYCNCGPYSRESGYYMTYERAEHALRLDDYERAEPALRLDYYTR